MTTHDEERDARLIDILRAGYAPAPLTPAEQARLRAAIAAGVTPARQRRWIPAAAALAAATAALVVAIIARQPPGAFPVAEDDDVAWEAEVLLADVTHPPTPLDEPAPLPDDYRALAAILFGRDS